MGTSPKEADHKDRLPHPPTVSVRPGVGAPVLGSVRVLGDLLESSDPSGVVCGVGGSPGFRLSFSTAGLLSRLGWWGEWGWMGMVSSFGNLRFSTLVQRGRSDGAPASGS